MFERSFDIRQKYTPKKVKKLVSHDLALRRAVENDKYDDCLYLIPYVGKEINTPGVSTKMTALHRAACNSNSAIFQLLEQNGASAHVRDATGKTPLDYANSTILKNREKYINYFSEPFFDLLNFNIFRYLNITDLTTIIVVSRFIRSNNFFFQFTQSFRNLEPQVTAELFNQITYETLLNKQEFHNVINNLSKVNKEDYLEQYNFQLPFGFQKLLVNELMIFILLNYLSIPTIKNIIEKHPLLAYLIFSSNGIILFSRKIFNEEMIKQVILSDSKDLFIWILKNKVNELLDGKVSSATLWDKRQGLKILLAQFGIAGTLTQALDIIANNRHLRIPIFNSMYDMTNNPWDTIPTNTFIPHAIFRR